MKVRTVSFPPHLRRFIETPEEVESVAESVKDVIAELDIKFPGIAAYLIHENGQLRQHVNIFLDDRLISDRENLSDRTSDIKHITIMQALSGG